MTRKSRYILETKIVMFSLSIFNIPSIESADAERQIWRVHNVPDTLWICAMLSIIDEDTCNQRLPWEDH